MDRQTVALALRRKRRSAGDRKEAAALRIRVENDQYRGLAEETREAERAARERELWILMADLMQLESQQFRAATSTTRIDREAGTISVERLEDMKGRVRRLLRTAIVDDPRSEALRRQCAAAAPFVLGDFYSMIGGVALIRRAAAVYTEKELDENDTLRVEFARGPSAYTTEGSTFRRAMDRLLNPLGSNTMPA